jgi:hypothetical protein
VNPSNPTQESRLQETVTVHVKLSDFLGRLVPEKKIDISIPAGCTVAEFIEDLASTSAVTFAGRCWRKAADSTPIMRLYSTSNLFRPGR